MSLTSHPATVIVDNPATGAVTELNPERFIFVTAAPTEEPSNWSSIPEITPVNSLPSPTNLVAVTIPLDAPRVIALPTLTESKNVDTPTTVAPPPTILIPDLAVTTPTESILVTSS